MNDKPFTQAALEVYEIVKNYEDEDLARISGAVTAFLGRPFGFGGGARALKTGSSSPGTASPLDSVKDDFDSKVHVHDSHGRCVGHDR